MYYSPCPCFNSSRPGRQDTPSLQPCWRFFNRQCLFMYSAIPFFSIVLFYHFIMSQTHCSVAPRFPLQHMLWILNSSAILRLISFWTLGWRPSGPGDLLTFNSSDSSKYFGHTPNQTIWSELSAIKVIGYGNLTKTEVKNLLGFFIVALLLPVVPYFQSSESPTIFYPGFLLIWIGLLDIQE